jgi:hypothetical protein
MGSIVEVLGACYSTKKKEEIGCIITFWLSEPTCSGCQFNGSTLNELVVNSILPLSKKKTNQKILTQ